MSKKRSYEPQAQFKRPRTTKVVSKQSVQTMVKQAMRSVAEKKWFDTLGSALSPTTGGAFVLGGMTSIDDGTEDFERVGAKISITAVQYHLEASLDAAETGSNLVRVILFCDKQSNGSAPTVTNILQNADFLSFRNLDNLQRFDILDDTVLELNASAGVSGTLIGDSVYKGVYKKVDYVASFASAAGAVPLTNNIGMLVIAKNTNGTYNVRSRLRFTDV